MAAGINYINILVYRERRTPTAIASATATGNATTTCSVNWAKLNVSKFSPASLPVFLL